MCRAVAKESERGMNARNYVAAQAKRGQKIRPQNTYFTIHYKYPPLVNTPQTRRLTTLPKAIPAESMVPRNAPSSLF